MKKLIHDMELAEQFIKGTISEQEKAKLADRFDHDQEFNTLIQDMDSLIDGIKYTGSKSTIEEKILTLKRFAEKTDEPEPDLKAEGKVVHLFGRQVTPNQFRYLVAATVLFFAATIFVVVQQLNLGPQSDLYAQYFEPFDSPGSGLTRSGVNGVSVKVEAYEAYDAGDYALATDLFEKSLLEKDEAIVRLCLANAYMAMNKFDKAETNLLYMLKEYTDLVTQTKWYLALTYVKQNKLERARATLWEISDSSTYGEKAKKVLDDLN